MKIFNSENGLLSRLLMGMGLAITGASFIRWTFVWVDLSNAIFGMIIGLGIAFAGWAHGMFKAISGEISSVKRQADTIGAWVTDNHMEAIKEEMRHGN